MATVRYVELINPVLWEDKEDCIFLDSALSYSGPAATAFSGMSHLAGKTITVLAAGKVYRDLVVSLEGTFSLPSGAPAVTKLHAGLEYTSTLKPMRLDSDQRIGPHIGHVKRLEALHMNVKDSAGMTYDVDGTEHVVEFPGSDADDQELFTGDIELDIKGGHSYDPELTLRQSDPLPMQVLALVVSYEVASG